MPAIIYSRSGDYYIVFPKRGKPVSTRNLEFVNETRKRFQKESKKVEEYDTGEFIITLYDMTIDELNKKWRKEYGAQLDLE